MMKIRRKNVRRPPTTFAGIEPTEEDHAKHARKIQDEIREDMNEIADAVGSDARDEVVVTSRGVDEEIVVTHDLNVTPERFRVVDKDGEGDLWRSRDHQWDDRVVYFKSSAEAGTAFTVVLFQKQKRREA